MRIRKYGDQILGDHLSRGTKIDGDHLSRGGQFYGDRLSRGTGSGGLEVRGSNGFGIKYISDRR